MDANDDLYSKELNLNCLYMQTIFGQKYYKPAIVIHSKPFSLNQKWMFDSFYTHERIAAFMPVFIRLWQRFQLFQKGKGVK